MAIYVSKMVQKILQHAEHQFICETGQGLPPQILHQIEDALYHALNKAVVEFESKQPRGHRS